MLGSVFGAVIFGTLLGPVVGTLAAGISTEVVFASVGVVSLGLVGWTLRHAEPPRPEREPQTHVGTLLRTPQVRLCLWLFLVEAAMVGATGTLLPLRLSQLGASGVAIGVTFVISSLCATVSSPVIGRVVDRRGARLPTCVDCWSPRYWSPCCRSRPRRWCSPCWSSPRSAGPSLAFVLPSISAVTETAERIGVEMAFALVVLNFAWAIGELVGAPTAAGLSHLTSDTVALSLVAAVILATLVVVLRTGLIRSASYSASAQDPPDECATEAAPDSPRISIAGG